MKEAIGKELKLVRIEKELSLEQAMKLSGINIGTISSYEKGKRNMSIEYVEKLLNAYQIPYHIFFRRVCEKSHIKKE